jgi:hypothetical protein
VALVPYAAPSTRTSTLHLDHEGHRIRNRRPPSSHMSPPATCQRIHSPWRCGCGRGMQVDCFSTFPPPLRVRCCCAESGQSAGAGFGSVQPTPAPHYIAVTGPVTHLILYALPYRQLLAREGPPAGHWGRALSEPAALRRAAGTSLCCWARGRAATVLSYARWSERGRRLNEESHFKDSMGAMGVHCALRPGIARTRATHVKVPARVVAPPQQQRRCARWDWRSTSPVTSYGVLRARIEAGC